MNQKSKPKIQLFGPQAQWPEKIIRPPVPLAHDKKILEIVTGKENCEGFDGLITQNKNIRLGMTQADCAVVCFFQEDKIGIIHAGWRGLCLGALEVMEQKFIGESYSVWVSPVYPQFKIQKDHCYEKIRQKFGDQFFLEFSKKDRKKSPQKIIFDFKSALASVLPREAIFDLRSTFKELTLASARRNQGTEKSKDRNLITLGWES